ncbi:MAG: Ig-like domain-containing protein, partial [Aeromonas veronii]
MLKKYQVQLHNLIISLLSLFILSCNNAPDDSSSKNNERVLVRVEISMSDVSANGASDLSVIKWTQQPLIAIGHYSDNTIEDLTKFVSWETKNSEIGTVDEKGIFRGLIEGSVIIIASIGGVVSDDFRLTVVSPALRYIQVSPSPISIARGQSQQLVATAIYSNGSNVDITNTVDWLSTETSVAIVTPSGVLMGISPGSTTITANFSGVSSNAVQSQITDASLVSIQVSPSPISIAHGQSKQLVATATYSNGTSADITNKATWLSTETSVAIVMPGGVLMGVSPGSTTVTANFSGVSSNAVQSQITDASLISIQVSPSPISIAHGQSKQLTATAIYSNGTSADITNTAAWLSTETSVAIVT